MFEDFSPMSYTPARSLDIEQTDVQSRLIIKNKQLINFVESVSQMVTILNQSQQIVYSNKSFSKFCKTINISSIIGKKIGETISCKNAVISAGGCGSSKFCKSCGVRNSVLKSQQGIRTTEECKVLTANDCCLYIRVTASPLVQEGERLTIFSITDITHEKRKESFGRNFIHDLLQSAGGIFGLSSILTDTDNQEEIQSIAKTIENSAVDLIDEIQEQRELCAAERGDLQAHFFEVDSMLILFEQKKIYANREINSGKLISIHHNAENHLVVTDKTLLSRIIGNMIKSASEENMPGDEIILNCIKVNGSVRFSVHNKIGLQNDASMYLFNDALSTIGIGKDSKIYNMKLLGEKYLKGKVGVESTSEKGITYFIELQK